MGRMLDKIFRTTWSLVNATMTTYNYMIQTNANREIKKAEKIISKFQVTRMLGKSSGTSGLSNLVNKTSAAFNAYIVGTTSYNTTEAAARAHELFIKDTKKKLTSCFIAQAIVNIILCMVTKRIYLIPVIIATMITTLMTNKENSELMGMHVITLLSSTNVIQIIIESIYTVTVAIELIPDRLKSVVGLLYLGTKIITSIIY